MEQNLEPTGFSTAARGQRPGREVELVIITASGCVLLESLGSGAGNFLCHPSVPSSFSTHFEDAGQIAGMRKNRALFWEAAMK